LEIVEKRKFMDKLKKTAPNTAYNLWRVNGYQQGFRFVVRFGFGGQESASKPPQAICKTLAVIAENPITSH